MKFGGELKRGKFMQSPCQSQVSYEIKPGCSGLYARGICLLWTQGKMLTGFNKTEISAEASNSVI